LTEFSHQTSAKKGEVVLEKTVATHDSTYLVGRKARKVTTAAGYFIHFGARTRKVRDNEKKGESLKKEKQAPLSEERAWERNKNQKRFSLLDQKARVGKQGGHWSLSRGTNRHSNARETPPFSFSAFGEEGAPEPSGEKEEHGGEVSIERSNRKVHRK